MAARTIILATQESAVIVGARLDAITTTTGGRRDGTALSHPEQNCSRNDGHGSSVMEERKVELGGWAKEWEMLIKKKC